MRTCCMNVSDPFTGWRPCWALLPRRRSRMPGTCSRSPAWRSSRTGLSGRGYRPPGLEAAGHAARVLHDAWQAALRAEADASAYFTPAVLGEDAEGLAARFGTDHHRLGKLSGDYRADKKTVASFTREGVAKDDAHRHLRLAVAWKQAADALWAAERAHAAILGAYYAGRPTDWNRLSGALACAAAVVRAARGQDLSRAAGLIGRDAVRDPAIARVADDTVRDLKTWHAVLATGPGRCAARNCCTARSAMRSAGCARTWGRCTLLPSSPMRSARLSAMRSLSAKPATWSGCGMRQMPHTYAWADKMPCSATLSVTCTQVPRPISQRSGLRWSGPGHCAS